MPFAPVPVLPRGITRIKGTVWFAEEMDVRAYFQCSGRRRFEYTHAGSWTTSNTGTTGTAIPCVQLVFIGPRLHDDAADAVQAALQACVVSPSPSPPLSPLTHLFPASVLSLFASQPRLQLIGVPASEPALSRCVVFRITGSYDSGKSVPVLAREFGVSADAMTTALMTRLNASGTGTFVVCRTLLAADCRVLDTSSGSDTNSASGSVTAALGVETCGDVTITVIVWAPHSSVPTGAGISCVAVEDAVQCEWGTLARAWPIVAKEAEAVARFALRNIPKCRCGW